MTSTSSSSSPATGSVPTRWRDLFVAPHRAAVFVMAGGIGLYAMNLYFTAALMPSVVADLDGRQFFAWASTAYLVTAVVATMLVSRLLVTRGSRSAYAIAAGLFGAGTLVTALAPDMGVFVAGRALQGLGAGLLTGLGFATIRAVLPAALWTRATGLISAMFGVGTLIGPAAGGAFAQADAWRAGFGVLAAAAVALWGLSRRALPAHHPRRDEARPRVPAASMALLALTAASLSVTSLLAGPLVAVAVVAGILLLVAFFAVDGRDPHGVLPRLAYARGSSAKWIYLTVAALCAGVMIENFIPLFAQQLAGASPLIAGLLGAVLSLGWTLAQLWSAGVSAGTARRLVRTGPVLLTTGLVLFGLLQTDAAEGWRVALWALVLLVAGAGIGSAFPHLSVAAMSISDDPAESAKAAAAVSTTQLIAFTLTSALAGSLIALGRESVLVSAQWVTFGIAAVAGVGILAARGATVRRR
ncbi:MAG: MFS transporter [Microbacterium arborescens]